MSAALISTFLTDSRIVLVRRKLFPQTVDPGLETYNKWFRVCQCTVLNCHSIDRMLRIFRNFKCPQDEGSVDEERSVSEMLPGTYSMRILAHSAVVSESSTYLRPKPQLKNLKSSLSCPFSSSHRVGMKLSPSGKTSGSRPIALEMSCQRFAVTRISLKGLTSDSR